MKLESCPWCGRKPGDWNWCEGGAQALCSCGVGGPAAKCPHDLDHALAAFAAWNAFVRKARKATVKVVGVAR